MSVRFQADADLKRSIVAGARRREPAIDFQSAQEAGLKGLRDPKVLDPSPGVFLVRQKADVGAVIDTLVLVWAASEPEEWENMLQEDPLPLSTAATPRAASAGTPARPDPPPRPAP